MPKIKFKNTTSRSKAVKIGGGRHETILPGETRTIDFVKELSEERIALLESAGLMIVDSGESAKSVQADAAKKSSPSSMVGGGPPISPVTPPLTSAPAPASTGAPSSVDTAPAAKIADPAKPADWQTGLVKPK